MIKIAPSLLACDFSKLGEEISRLDAAGADVLHFDVMDGHFVPNLSIGVPVMESVRKVTKIPFDAHLMVENADKYIEPFAAAGANWISVHVEVTHDLVGTLKRIKKLGMKAGIAINPGTPLQRLDEALYAADFVLVMSVNPGFGGQSFIPETLMKIKELRKKIGTNPIQIEVDGGIKEHNISEIAKAGAEIIVVGTGLFSLDPDYAKGMQKLRSKAMGNT
jgi:ribulose-phosphate 3-epimerase